MGGRAAVCGGPTGAQAETRYFFCMIFSSSLRVFR